MKVCHVIPVLDPRTGGPPAIAAALAAEQTRAGCPAAIACFATPDARDRIDAMLRDTPGSASVPIHLLPPLNRFRAFTAWGVGKPLRRLAAEHDLLHLHGVWDPVILAASRAARAANRPYVLSGHGMLEPWSLSRHPLRKRLFWSGGFGGMLLNLAALHEHRPGPYRVCGHTLPAPVHVIGNGIFPPDSPGPPDREQTRPAWSGLLRRFPQLARGRVLLFLARLAEQKGVDMLIPAFAEVARDAPDVTLLLAGADYGMGHVVRALVARNQLADRVAITGPLAGPEKAAALAWSDAFVLPSRHEGFSVAVLEAMLAGLPCAITDACHFEHAGRAGAAVLARIDPLSDYSAALVPALTAVLGPAGPELARRGRELVLSHYTWRAVAAEHLHMYARALSGKAGP